MYNDPGLEHFVKFQAVVSISQAIFSNISFLLAAITTYICTTIATYHSLTAVFSVTNNI